MTLPAPSFEILWVAACGRPEREGDIPRELGEPVERRGRERRLAGVAAGERVRALDGPVDVVGDPGDEAGGGGGVGEEGEEPLAAEVRQAALDVGPVPRNS